MAQLGVAALKPLYPDIGSAERGRCHLHADPSDFVNQHCDIAGAHQRLFLDLLARDYLDPQRLMLQAPPEARALNDDLDFLFFRSLVIVFSDFAEVCRPFGKRLRKSRHRRSKDASHAK